MGRKKKNILKEKVGHFHTRITRITNNIIITCRRQVKN